MTGVQLADWSCAQVACHRGSSTRAQRSGHVPCDVNIIRMQFRRLQGANVLAKIAPGPRAAELVQLRTRPHVASAGLVHTNTGGISDYLCMKGHTASRAGSFVRATLELIRSSASTSSLTEGVMPLKQANYATMAIQCRTSKIRQPFVQTQSSGPISAETCARPRHES